MSWTIRLSFKLTALARTALIDPTQLSEDELADYADYARRLDALHGEAAPSPPVLYAIDLLDAIATELSRRQV